MIPLILLKINPTKTSNVNPEWKKSISQKVWQNLNLLFSQEGFLRNHFYEDFYGHYWPREWPYQGF